MLLILFAAIGNYSSPRGQCAGAGTENRGGGEGAEGRPAFTLALCHPYYFTVISLGKKLQKVPISFWTAVKNTDFSK